MIQYSGLTSQNATAYRQGAQDANGGQPETLTSAGKGFPCRHCLCEIEQGKPTLLLSHRPFETLQPYSETGPIFLCAETCPAPDGALPKVLEISETYLIKAYDHNERIIYGTGAIVPRSELDAEIAKRLSDHRAVFVDIRSAKNNCWLARARNSD